MLQAVRPFVRALQLGGINLGNVVEGAHSIHMEERGLALSWGGGGAREGWRKGRMEGSKDEESE